MQRQLSELDSARKRFIAIASHELRTPLFSLGGFIELLRDEDLDEETRRRFLDELREQVDRLRSWRRACSTCPSSRRAARAAARRTDLGELARTVSNEFTPALARTTPTSRSACPAGP